MRTIILKNPQGSSDTWVGQTIAASGTYTIQSEQERDVFSNNDKVNQDIWSDPVKLVVNDGVNDLSPSAGDKWLKNQDDNLSNTDGRKIYHATPRQFGTVTYFTGAGDDPATEYATGGANGQAMTWHHEVGQDVSQSLIVDINSIENLSYLHAGALQWKDALNDEVTFEVIPKVTPYTADTGTDYTLYGGYLIIPSTPGAGDIAVASGDRVLVEVPINEKGDRLGAGYYDADWNTTLKQWDNFAINYYGTGQFNMFAAEVVLDRFANRLSVLGSGMSPLGTHDASMFGHNNRGKLTYKTLGADHEWWGSCWLVLHRKRTT